MTISKEDRIKKAIKYGRYFLTDTPELNLLLRTYETDDDKMLFCIDMAISDYNITAPILRPPIGIMNYPSLYLLMHGIAIQALKSAGLFQLRNSLPYSSGGSNFHRYGKHRDYLAFIQLFSNDYELKKRQFKVTENISRGWGGYGGVHSEYYQLGWNF